MLPIEAGQQLQAQKGTGKRIIMKNIKSGTHQLRSLFSVVLCAGILLLPLVGLTAPAASVSTSTSTKAVKVDVNNADVTTLQTLPGVGPAIAEKIVANRPYRSYADLEKVSGLSKSKVDAMKGQVTFGATTAKTESKSSKSVTTTSSTPSSKSVTTTTTKPAASEKSTVTSTSSKSLSATGKVNINTASQEELDVLPGIGPVRAQAIMDYRKEHGNFKSIEEIKNVKGIKDGEFSKIEDRITVR